MLHYSTDNESSACRPNWQAGNAANDPWQTTLRNVRRDVRYYLSGGDAISRTYSLHVLPGAHDHGGLARPRIPRLHRIPGRQGVEGAGNIEAIEGTWVTVHARANQPGAVARIEFGKATLEPQHAGRQRAAGTQRPVPGDRGRQLHDPLQDADGQINLDR
ncbi:MAG: hypothetical protein U0800_17405 [Isosphaeraceae bacterium]